MPDVQVWRQRSKCKDLSPKDSDAIFFLKPGGSANAARAYCGACPVRTQCLDFALVHHEVGVWAGTTEADRALMEWMVPLVIEKLRIRGTLENRVLNLELVPSQVRRQTAADHLELVFDEIQELLEVI